MAGLKRSRQRQSRLAFTPIPSSSPAAKGYNKQIQDRAAAVSVASSTSKRRKLQDQMSDDELGEDQFDGAQVPTPTASLRRNARHEVDSGSDSEPVRSTQRRTSTQTRPSSRKTSRQQRLDFTGSRDADTFSSPIKLPSSSRPQSSARAGIFGTQPNSSAVNISSDESDEELPSPRKLMAKGRTKKAGKINDGALRTTRSARQPITVGSESEGENITVSGGAQEEHPQLSEDEDDDMPTTAGKQRRQRRKRASSDDFITSSPPRMIDSDDDLEIIEQPKKRRRQQNGSEGEETPSKRKLKGSRKKSRREEDDLAEDMDFLGPSSDVEALERNPRNTQTAQKDARKKALERLKKQRKGPVAAPENDGQQDDYMDDYMEGSDEVEEQDNEEEVHQQPMSSRQFFKEDEYDRGFVDSDENDQDPLGIPDDLPLEFTRYASMKPKELFKYAVEWMVQKKINPAFAMTDDIYDLTFRKLDDEVKGLAGSKFKSAAWTPEFTMSLNSRPNVAYEQIDQTAAEHFLRDHCDACNRTNYPATFQIQFQGNPYHRETLEEVAGNDDEDDESTSEDENEQRDKDDEPSYDAEGREVPPANTIYYVGKFCMSNAQTGHSLQHWKYHLNDWVVSWLIKSGYDTPEKIVQRDRWSTIKRRKYANRIVDRMEEEGVVRTLWKDFRGNIDEARDSKQGRYGAWSP